MARETTTAELMSMIQGMVESAVANALSSRPAPFIPVMDVQARRELVKESKEIAAESVVGEFGKRTLDSWCWTDQGSGTIEIGNMFVDYNGVVEDWGVGTLSVTGTKYAYAEVQWSVDSNGGITGISTVTLGLATTYADASKKLADNAGYRIPLYKFIYISGSWGNNVVARADYIHGTPRSPDKPWLTDADSDASIKRCSLSRDAHDTDSTLPDVLGLYDFKEPSDFTLMNPMSGSWPTGGDTLKTQLLMVRSVEGALTCIRFARHNPMPSGDDTDVAAKWDDDKKGWTNVVPVDTTNDEQSTELSEGDRVVTGAKTGTDGLVQLITQPLGSMSGGGGTPTGYTETTAPIEWQYDASAHKWQYKTATILVKDGTTAATWTDGITFAQFSD